MRVLLTALALLAVAFAGCAGGDDDPQPTPTSSSSASSSSGNTTSRSGTSTSATSTSTGPAEEAPTGSVSLVLNGTLATFNLTGNDADGDALDWTLDFGDGNATDGSSLPATVNHTYAPGNYTAVYNVTDGTSTATYNLTLNVTAGGPTSQDFEAEWSPATNPACADPSAPYDAVPGAFAQFAIDAGTQGAAFTATFDSGAAQDHLLFLDAAGEILLHVTTGLPSDPDWVAEGTVPAGAVTGVFYGCAGLPSEHVVYHAG